LARTHTRKKTRSSGDVWEIVVTLPVNYHPAGGWTYRVRESKLRTTLKKLLDKYGDLKDSWGNYELEIGLRPPKSFHIYWLTPDDVKKLLQDKIVEATITLGLNDNAYGRGRIKLP